MAGTIQSQFSILIQADGDATAAAASSQLAMTGSRAVTQRFPVTATPAQVPVGSCATLGKIVIKNLSGQPVVVGLASGSQTLSVIPVGEAIVLSKPTAAPYVWTATSTAEVKVTVCEI